ASPRMHDARSPRRRRFATTRGRSGSCRRRTRSPKSCATPCVPSKPRRRRWWRPSRATPPPAADGCERAMNEVSAEAIQRMWIVSLLVYGVVLVVVAVLLTLILRAAREVRGGVSAIWTVGQQIANNTIHIALLDTTNHVVDEILVSAEGVVAATAALRAHAARCPGCP